VQCNAGVLQLLLSSSGDDVRSVLDTRDGFGYTALSHAVAAKDAQCVGLILDAYGSPQSAAAALRSPLISMPAARLSATVLSAAVASGCGPVAAAMLARVDAADVEQWPRDRAGRTLLMFAASSLSEDVVDTLLALGCDPAAVDARGRSALVYAIVRSGFVGAPAERAVSIVHRLLTVEGAALLSPLCRAAGHGSHAIVEVLLDKLDHTVASSAEDLMAALEIAASKRRGDNFAVLLSFLRANTPAVCIDRTVLVEAAAQLAAANPWCSELTHSRELFEDDADCSRLPVDVIPLGQSAAEWAEETGHVDVAELLRAAESTL
jgi:ankyrin repeat protein